MTLSKELLYDWHGKNEWLFTHINGFRGDLYDAAMVLLSRSGEAHNFPYYMGALAIWVLLGYMIRKIRHKGGAAYHLSAWFAVFLVLTASFGVDAVVVHHLKSEFSYPRPYAAGLHTHVRVLDEDKKDDDDYHSFPSGHSSFATLMVMGLLPVLSGIPGAVCVCWMLGVMWSRMAVGMHFPADVLGGFAIAIVIVLIVRAIVYRLLRKLFKLHV